jgi:hypothetical protein
MLFELLLKALQHLALVDVDSVDPRKVETQQRIRAKKNMSET